MKASRGAVLLADRGGACQGGRPRSDGGILGAGAQCGWLVVTAATSANKASMSNGLARNPRAPTEAARCGLPSAEMTTMGMSLVGVLDAEHLREGDAVHDRHHEVEQDDGGPLLLHAVQRLPPWRARATR